MTRKPLLTLFLLSGISSLIYEICWVRQATLTFGVSIYAYSAVLTAYMGGMAIGGYLIGKRADKAAHPLRLFAWLQVGLAGLGLLAPFALDGLTTLYAALAHNLAPGLTVLTALRLGMSLLVLTPPAICIGATLPVMSRAYVRHGGQVGRDVGGLYAVNTLGAVLGCLLTAIFLIRLLGLRETVFLAALINLLVAGVAWHQSPRFKGTGTTRSHAKPARSERFKAPATRPAALRFVLWAYALSGFTSLGYEVVWARIISLHTVNAVYSFSIMLAVYLSGLVVGSLAGTWWVRRRRASVVHFGGLELGIGLLAVLVFFTFAQLPKFRLEDVFSEYSIAAEMAFEGLLSFATLFPVTVLIGTVFPVVSSLYTSERAEQVGLKVAQVTALNTAGSILGSLLTGFVVVPLLGLQRSALALAALNLGIGCAAIWFFSPAESRRRLIPATGVVATAAVVAAVLLPPARYLGYWQNAADQLIFYKEGVETTVAVFEPGPNNPKFSTVNGRVEVPTDILSMRAFHLLGHLPPLLRPDAENSLMLSFGNGIATGALTFHQIPSVEVVELSPEMVEAAEMYAEENRHVLQYPDLQVHIEDARNFLLQTDRQYDIITTDATHPSNSCSWTLFTTEFYQQVDQHLAPDGVFLQWVPLHSMAIADYLTVLRTFQGVFPNATLWYTGGSHTLLLSAPRTMTVADLDETLSAVRHAPELAQDLGTEEISRYWIMNSGQLREFAGQGDPVTDNDAFFLPINAEIQELIQIIQLAAVRANP